MTAAAPAASASTWSLRRGASVGDDGTSFAVWAPKATRVAVRVIGRRDHALVRGDRGVWYGVVDADDLHHAIHAALTGERGGYYADFGGVGRVARALETPFVYDGRYSVHRRRMHGTPATGRPAEQFVVCVQNHDQVGNRAKGDRLTSPASGEGGRARSRQRIVHTTAPITLPPYSASIYSAASLEGAETTE